MRQRHERGGDTGFTLIELLLVIVVVGILAAIAVPVFLSQRTRAQTTTLRTDVSNLGRQVTMYYLEAEGAVVIDTTGRPGYVGVQGTPTENYTLLSPGTRASYPTYTTSGVLGEESTTWCVALARTGASPETYRYTATAGLEPGLCS